MKKLLSLITVLSISAISTSNMISCNSTNKEIIYDSGISEEINNNDGSETIKMNMNLSLSDVTLGYYLFDISDENTFEDLIEKGDSGFIRLLNLEYTESYIYNSLNDNSDNTITFSSDDSLPESTLNSNLILIKLANYFETSTVSFSIENSAEKDENHKNDIDDFMKVLQVNETDDAEKDKEEFRKSVTNYFNDNKEKYKSYSYKTSIDFISTTDSKKKLTIDYNLKITL